MAIQNPGIKNRNLRDCIRLATAGCASVVELGCGFGDRIALVDAASRIGVDAHEPYLAEARRRYPDIHFVVGNAREFIRIMPNKGIDAVLMVDFLEHLERQEARELVQDCKRAAGRIVLWVPLGYHPQTRDVYGMGGDEWQTHRSTWEVKDLALLGFDAKVWPTVPPPGLEPRAAFCVWEAS